MGKALHDGNGSGHASKTTGKAKASLRRFGDADFDALVAGLAAGLTFRQAAKATGFRHGAAYDYLRLNPDKIDAYKRACKARWLIRLQELAEGQKDWRAFGWLLERNFPGEFALHSVNRTELSGSVTTLVERIDEHELLEMAQRAANIAGERPTHGLG